MPHAVLLTDDAARDLDEIFTYIAGHDAPANAEYVLSRIEAVFQSLAEFPERGTYPKELQRLGIREYREVYFKPYRIVYRLAREKVYVLLIADGRRDMQTLLMRRLLNG